MFLLLGEIKYSSRMVLFLIGGSVCVLVAGTQAVHTVSKALIILLEIIEFSFIGKHTLTNVYS